LHRFQQFLKLCAGHIGQMINFSSFDEGKQQTAVEMKASRVINNDFFKGLDYWYKHNGQEE